MKSASNRLPLRTLPAFFAESLKVHTRLFTAYVQKNDIGHIRAAIVVPKKNEKLSTRRNAVKRRLFPLVCSAENSRRSVDVVLRMRGGETAYDKKSFLTDLEQVFHRIDKII